MLVIWLSGCQSEDLGDMSHVSYEPVTRSGARGPRRNDPVPVPLWTEGGSPISFDVGPVLPREEFLLQGTMKFHDSDLGPIGLLIEVFGRAESQRRWCLVT